MYALLPYRFRLAPKFDPAMTKPQRTTQGREPRHEKTISSWLDLQKRMRDPSFFAVLGADLVPVGALGEDRDFLPLRQGLHNPGMGVWQAFKFRAISLDPHKF